MKKYLTTLLVALCLSFSLSQSFLLVEPYGDSDWNIYCSGAIVNDIAFTAAHCITSVIDGPIYIQDVDGNVYSASYVTHRFDGDFDYAVLSGPFTHLIGSYDYNPDVNRFPSQGADITYVGNLGNLGIFTDKGEYYGQLNQVLGLSDSYAGDHLAQLNVAKGSSGGIVLYYGYPVGILVATAPTTLTPWMEIIQPPQLAIFKDFRLAYIDYHTSTLQ